MALIDVSRLAKRYGDHVAVDDLTFQVEEGEVVGFLGPNGAGKSTTLRVLAGFLAPSGGVVRIGGHDVTTAAEAAKRLVGYMPESVPLYPEMRTREYLAFRAELKGVPSRDRRARVAWAMEAAHVDDVASVAVGTLSKGYRQRVGLADALVAKPPLLILDEPTAGMDPNQIREVRDLVRELGKAHTVLLSTHILGEVEAVCARAVVIARGKLVADGTLDALAAERRAAAVVVTVRGAADAALAAARAAGVDAPTARVDGDVVALTCPASDDARVEALVEALVAAGLGVRAVARAGSSLEDVFASLTEPSS